MDIQNSHLLDALSLPAFAIDKNHTVILWNKACEILTGILASDILGTKDHWKGFYSDRRPCLADLVLDGVEQELKKFYKTHNKSSFFDNAYQSENWFYTHGNKKRFLLFEAKVMLDENNNILGAIEVLHDLTEHKQTLDNLKLSASVFDNTSEGIIITDEKTNIITGNKALEKLTGFQLHDFIGKKPKIFSSGSHSKDFYESMWKSLQEFGHWQGEFSNKKKNGEEYLVRTYISKVILDNGDINYIALLTDITESNKVLQEMDFLAHHDFLTKLPNRILLEDRLSLAFNRAERTNTKCAIFFLDLDKFKNVNDSLGHNIGDLLLKEVAQRLTSIVRNYDTVARQGGDEFVILLESIKDEMDVAYIAQKIIQVINIPFLLNEHQVSITTSLGISIFPNDGTNVADLLKHADTAMYFSKSNGRNNYQFYTESMNAHILSTIKLVNKLNLAIPSKLEVYFQPQYSTLSQSIYGAEALIRWKDDELGFVSPARFIPIAEDSGQIKEIGKFVLEKSCELIKKTGLKISVNLSPVQLEDKDLFVKIKHYIKNIDPSLLTLEITENAFIKNIAFAKTTLIELKKLGVNLALDDFGTGYSSLSYLQQLPFDYLKIDQSFIRENNNFSIVLAIIEMADRLHLKTIAEGVEELKQLNLLKDSGCSIIQGYYYSKPLPESEFLNFISSKTPIFPNEKISTNLFKNLGYNLLDFEHQELFDHFSSLEQIVLEEEQENLNEQLFTLYEKVLDHFINEEDDMLNKKYPHYDTHRTEHQKFLKRCLHLQLQVSTKKTSLATAITFVRRWLIGHILTHDKNFIEFIIKNKTKF